MNSESKIWENLKADYLSQIEKVLASVDNPRTKEILEDVGAHLDRRFGELSLLQQTKENYQKIIFEMGPASDYAELLGETAKKQYPEKVPVRWNEILRKIGINAAFSVVIIAIVAVLCKVFISPDTQKIVDSNSNSITGDFSVTTQTTSRGTYEDKIDFPFVNDADAIGGWESVDFVDNTEDFIPGKIIWKGDLWFKELRFYVSGKTDCAYEWTKGLLLHGGDKTASKYFIKDMNGSKYLFLEWKSGDYTIRHMKPSWYVMVKTDSKSLPVPSIENKSSPSIGMIMPLGIIQGIIMIVICIPLLNNSIKPNAFYGFRTPKAYSSPEIWYKTNRYGAEEVIASGVVMIILSVLPALLISGIFASIQSFAICIMVGTVPLAVAVMRSMLYLRKF